MTADLSTRYLGMQLANPLVVAAGPCSGNLGTLARLADAGAAAAVLPSLFEEQIEHEELQVHRLHEFQAESSPESLTFFPDLGDYNTGPDGYLRHLELARQTVSIPIIASLNGSSPGGWLRYGRLLEQSGADALELNIYYVPTAAEETAAQVEARYVDLVGELASQVRLPLAVKIGPYFTALPQFAARLAAAGAAGLVLFNRYLEPEVDPFALRVTPHLDLSRRAELRLPLRWIAILRDQLGISLAASSGIHTVDDVVKALLVGADVTMMASVLIRHGADHLTGLLAGLSQWLAEHDYTSVRQLQGSLSRVNSSEPSAFERANYMRALVNYTTRET